MAILVPAGVALRNELNLLNPKRDRTSDGWIADEAHMKAGSSDHIPDKQGRVHAIDVDEDGLEVNKIVGHLVSRCKAGAEKRIKYVIWNRTIWSAVNGWKARKYTGANPHTHHFHISFVSSAELANSKTTFGISALGKRVTKPSKTQPAVKAGSRTLRVGMNGKDVEFVERWLGVKADGLFDPALKKRVEQYQRMRGISVDGVVGKNTWRQMGVKT